MIRRTLITSTILASFSVGAFAQNNITVVREVVPTKSQPIIANSPQDLALQEEIRRIRAYNTQIDSQIGISDAYSYAPITMTPSVTSVANKYTLDNKYKGEETKPLPRPTTTVTYTSTPVQPELTGITTSRSTLTYTRIHRVVEDDTLYNLARRNCVSVVDIQNQNAMHDNDISVGQALTLPANQCGATVISATTPAQIRSEFGIVRQVMPLQTNIKAHAGNTYAVLPKDSLYSIGKRYCLTADELVEFNNIDTETPIKPGQILRLPKVACN